MIQTILTQTVCGRAHYLNYNTRSEMIFFTKPLPLPLPLPILFFCSITSLCAQTWSILAHCTTTTRKFFMLNFLHTKAGSFPLLTCFFLPTLICLLIAASGVLLWFTYWFAATPMMIFNTDRMAFLRGLWLLKRSLRRVTFLWSLQANCLSIL